MGGALSFGFDMSSGTAVYWLRFEPFILHVCCRDLVAAGALMAAARGVFKNVGLQGFDSSKLIVAIWGDEGLDMPLTGPEGVPLFPGNHTWLQSLVNSRHHRNWAKIDRFTAAVRQMEEPIPSAEPNGDTEGDKELKHFDVVGDIAIVNVKPKEELSVVGNAILKQDQLTKSPSVLFHAVLLPSFCTHLILSYSSYALTARE